jgi:hypothetical protein
MAIKEKYYTQVGPSASDLEGVVPGTVTIEEIAPGGGLEIAFDDKSEADLDEAMLELGYVPGDLPSPQPTWKRFTKTFADFAASANQGNSSLFDLPPGGVVHAAVLRATEGFKGGSLTDYKISVGVVNTPAKYAPQLSVFDPANEIAAVVGVESFAAPTTIIAQANSVGAQLSAATQGSVDIWVLWSVLPS